MTTLPPDFHFSQSSLSDYTACARRFELRYLQRLQWPAVESEPLAEREHHMRQGDQFHRLVQQHQLGVPVEALNRTAMDDLLRRWWTNYLNADLHTSLPAKRKPEITLSVPLAGQRLVAKYDLLAVAPGDRAVIVDWKTSRRQPNRRELEQQLQTVVYRYVLVEAGTALNGGQPLAAEQVEMVYWFAEHARAEYLPYSAEQHAADRDLLTGLIQEIELRQHFELTEDQRRCRFCVYRSLCERGVRAGDAGEDRPDSGDEPDLDELDFDFDQIAEVEF
jgi:predicted RecB family nuclease